MTNSPFVSTAWLAEHIHDPNIRVLEIGSTKDDAVYRTGHIPGAFWFYWKDACWHRTDRELIKPTEMAAQFSRLGVTPDTTLVLYGDPIQYGCYAYWVFKMAGHRKLRLLDGGRKRWEMDNFPLSRAITQFPECIYPVPEGDQSIRVGRRNVRDHLGVAGRLLLDVRSPEEFSGERVIEYSAPFDHGAERKGHIPGARNLYYRNFLNEDDTMKTADGVAAVLRASGIEVDACSEIVCYCRLSHRASLAWLALSAILGQSNVKVYDGSWTEWGSIVGYPIEMT
ncbi:MAG: sulfurtransferase [Hyphomicrobiaceae bacterium]